MIWGHSNPAKALKVAISINSLQPQCVTNSFAVFRTSDVFRCVPIRQVTTLNFSRTKLSSDGAPEVWDTEKKLCAVPVAAGRMSSSLRPRESQWGHEFITAACSCWLKITKVSRSDMCVYVHKNEYVYIVTVYVKLFIYICLFFYLFVSYLCNCLINYQYIISLLSISLFIYLSVYLPTYLSIYPSIHPSIHLSIYLSIYRSIDLCIDPIYRSIGLSVYRSIMRGCLKGIPPSTYLIIIIYYSGNTWLQKNELCRELTDIYGILE